MNKIHRNFTFLRSILPGLALLLVISCARETAISYEIAETHWPESFGNHSAVLTIDDPVEVVRIQIPWRRHDPDPQDKMLLLISAETGESRWFNYCIEGLRWLVRNVDIDGLYLDDVSFDRHILKRMRKVMELVAPEIEDFQEHQTYAISERIRVPSRKGYLIYLKDKKQKLTVI